MMWRSVFALSACLLLAPVVAQGADTIEMSPAKRADPDFEAGSKAVKAKQWTVAIDRLGKAVKTDSTNADAWNLLGYSYRNAGDLPNALKSYEQALRIDPKHRGANEYIGQTYVLMGDPAKAQMHLARLEMICGTSCEEYRDLKKAIEGAPRK